jgi:hypothetical protein
MSEKSAVMVDVCDALSDGLIERAASLVRSNYPFVSDMMTQRKYGAVESTRVFIRDGFIDRYTGKRLIFPPVLRILSIAACGIPIPPKLEDGCHPSRILGAECHC